MSHRHSVPLDRWTAEALVRHLVYDIDDYGRDLHSDVPTLPGDERELRELHMRLHEGER